MPEYLIITILSLALIGTYWRKRVWKKRAKAKYLGFWGMIDGWRKEAETETLKPLFSPIAAGTVRNRIEWPDTLDDK